MALVDSNLVAELRAAITGLRSEYVDLLARCCEIESGSEMVEGVDQVGDLIAAKLRAIGLAVTSHPVNGFGAHRVATTGLAGAHIVLGGHIDTTYTDYAPLPRFRVDGDFAWGPGTSDMRGGVLTFVAALEALANSGRLAALPITVLLNTDEERGAPTSRDLFREHARHCLAALFGECAGANGEVVVSRRAKLSYRVDVRGIGRHAGDHAHEKTSALVALSHKIVAIEAQNDVFAGASFNVGRAWGGIASNTVPGEAVALTDIRYPLPEQEAPIRAAMADLCAAVEVPGAETTITETSFRPAWQERDSTTTLYRLAEQVATDLGMPVAPESRGGTADSNWFGAAGVPCLDGLGPVGFGDHTPEERIVLETMFDRSLLVACLVLAIAAGHEGRTP